MRFSLFLVSCLFLCIAGAAAQATVSKQALRYYNKSLGYKALKKDAKAEEYMLMTIKKAPALTEAYVMLGSWLMNEHRYAEAAQLYKRVATSGSKNALQFRLPYLRSLIYSGHPQDALNSMSGPQDSVTDLLKQQALLQLRLTQKGDTAKAQLIGPLWRVNTSDAEMYPSLSADGNTLYFTRRVNGMDEDFFFAKPDSCGGWLNAENMGTPPNSRQQEAAQFISADGHYLFYMRCDNRSYGGWDGGGCDLFMAYTADSVWSIAQSFGGTINTAGFEGMPCLSADNRELFFVSDRPGGYGGLDIWVAKFEQGLWQMPRNLGPQINTPGDETAPYLHADGRTIYFASTGHPGLGGSDLFTSRRETADTLWSAPQHLGMPINSTFDEASMTVSPDGKQVLFASNRDSLNNNYDLYVAAMPEVHMPLPVTYVVGRTYDSLTRSALTYANIYIADSNGRELYQVITNRGDGSYMMALPAGQYYTCYISRIGYSPKFDTIYCYAPTTFAADTNNISMLPYDYVKPVRDSLIITINFAKNEAVISEELGMDIQSALRPWETMKDAFVMVNGYTDNSGTPMINEHLSTLRARLVKEVITKMNFAGGSVSHQGWGEAEPTAPNDTDEHRDQNRRVEVVVRW